MTRVATLVAVLILLALALSPVHAAQPRVGAAAAGLTREVYAFFDAGDREYMLTTADFSVLSTVAYFAMEAQPDGSLRPSAAWASEWMGQVIERAHAAGTKVVLTVSRFGWNAQGRDDTIALLRDPAARARVAVEAAEAVVARGADGINLDLEPMIAGLQDEFVDLVRQLRAALDARQPGLSLVFDVTGYSSYYPIGEALAPGGADAVFVMAYPFHTRLSAKAGAVSPMAGLTFDVTEATDRAVNQSSPDRVILGLANFGMEWPTETRRLHSATRKDSALYGSPRSMSLGTAADLAARYGRRWDAQQLVPWTRWRARACAGCPRTWHQLYYDDTQSTAIKYDFVNARNLRGVGMWQLGFGPDRFDFYDLLREKFTVQ